MRPDRQEIILAYQLFLNRKPNAGEADRMTQNVESVAQLRQIFLNSPEFARLHSVGNSNQQPKVSRPDRDKTVIHLHIPKTAGTSLNTMMGDQYPGETKFTVGENTLDSLQSLPADKKRNVKFLFGHMAHGVHNLLPQDHLYLSILRRPGERLLSYYNYAANRQNHPLHGVATQKGSTFGSFLSHIAQKPRLRPEFDNGQMRRIAGDMTPEGIGSEAALLRQSLSNAFNRDFLFGFTEHFSDFQRELVSRGLLQRVTELRKNAAPQTANLISELLRMSKEDRKIFDGFIRWDDVLYNTCLDLSCVGKTTESV